MISIKLIGLERVNRFMVKLSKEMEKEIHKNGKEFAKNTQKSAKLRAPRFTGQLAESISVKDKKNKIIVSVDSPYGIFQELGFTPKFLPKGMPVQGGYRISDWMGAHGLTGSGIMPSGQPKYFVTQALETNLSKLPSLLSQGTKNAIKNARR